MPVVRFERRGAIGWITLDRPRVLNASTLEMKRELSAILAAAAADDGLGALVLTGAGRAFCVGGDTKESASFSDDAYAHAIRAQHRVCAALHDLDKPIIAAVNGFALGGGLEMAMLCDMRIAAATAKLGNPVARVGSVATGALYRRLVATIGLARATELTLLADPIAAEEAARIGLVNRVVADDALLGVVEELAARIAALPRLGVTLAKRALRRAADLDFAGALAQDEALAIEARRKGAD